jgi:hypothetical protein
MAKLQGAGGTDIEGDANGTLQVGLYDPNGNPIPKARGGASAATDRLMPMAGLNDDNYRALRVDRMGNQGVALNNVLFSEPFEGATISVPNRVTVSGTGFTPAQTSTGGLNLNNTNVITSAAGAMVVSNRRFAKLQRAPLHAKFRARLGHVTNAVMELGFGAPASQLNAPTVGAYWQVAANGTLQGVVTFNGVDTTTSAVALGSGWQSNYYTWDVVLDDDEAIFAVQDSSTGLILAERRIQLPLSGPRLWDASRLPVYVRQHHPTAPASAPNLIVTSIDVVMLDAFLNRPWGQTAALNGQGAEVNPTTFAQTAQFANSAAPASATLSNTTAGYTTLGGLFQFAAVAGAATDYALFGFTVPAPYSLIVTGISIDTWNTGAAVATTPTLLNWFASPDQTAVSLATASNRRVPLGAQSLAIGAAVGARADRWISEDFASAPLVTNPGRFFVIGLRMPVATATASQIIAGMVTIKGQFE